MSIIMSIILVVLLIIAILLILIVAAKNKELKGDPNMIKTTYNYLVLFATLMMVIGGGVGIFMSTADIIFPNAYYQTFDDYKNMKITPETSKNETGEEISKEDLRNSYDDLIKENTLREVNRAKNTFVKSFGWVLIPLPVFIYFQRRIGKKENE